MRLILVIAGALLLSSPVMAGTKTKHVKCSSKDGDFKRCKVSGIKKISNMSVKKRYSDSKCKKGYSYGYDKKSIWVDHGCRAKFNVRYKKSSSSKYKTKSVKCSSKDHDFKRCRVKHAKKIKNMSVKKRYSDASCKKGYSYGYSKKSIWVDHGCRAKFKVKYRN